MNWSRWIVASLLLHGSLVGVASRRARRGPIPTAQSAPTEVELVPLPPGALNTPDALRVPDPRATLPALGGRRSAQNVDGARRGEGGDGRSEESGLRLAARPEGVNLDPRTLNTLHDRQEQRIRTARERASPQDDRRTPNPADDPWVTTGSGVILFRLASATAMPAVGASVRAGPPQPAPSTAEEVSQTLAPQGDPHVGSGVRDPLHGASHRVAGPMRTQRPDLAPGHAATTSDLAARRPDDDVDSALLAASLQRAFVSSTVHAGPQRAAGVGGVGGGGAPGVGGSEGRGGRASPLGDGDGWVSLSSDDARYMRYLLEVRRRLEPLWADAFPRDEALRLNQGTVIVSFVITAEGAVREVSLRRRSGVDRFDANVLAAVRRAVLPPIPAALGVSRLNIRAPFEFRNPLVR
jgi:TonB family protein